jgi:hypothetical protein
VGGHSVAFHGYDDLLVNKRHSSRPKDRANEALDSAGDLIDGETEIRLVA